MPKQNIPTYNEFYEGRHFSVAEDVMIVNLPLQGSSGTFGANQIFVCESMPELKIAGDL